MSTAPAVLRTVVTRDGGKQFEIARFEEPNNPDSRAVLTGVIEMIPGTGRERVHAFVNDRKDKTGTFISLSAQKIDDRSGEMNWETIAIGNVVNGRGDGSEVYFDTILFNPTGPDGTTIPGSKPVSVYVTRACPPELHTRLGFTQPRVDRPARPDAPSESYNELDDLPH